MDSCSTDLEDPGSFVRDGGLNGLNIRRKDTFVGSTRWIEIMGKGDSHSAAAARSNELTSGVDKDVGGSSKGADKMLKGKPQDGSCMAAWSWSTG